MKRIEVPLNSLVVTCWYRKHPQIDAFVQVGANLRTDINDWCMYNLSSPVISDRLYRSMEWNDAVGEKYETTLAATSIRLLFATEADHEAFVNRWMTGATGAN